MYYVRICSISVSVFSQYILDLLIMVCDLNITQTRVVILVHTYNVESYWYTIDRVLYV